METPFEEDWRVQTLSLAWDEDRQRLVIECYDHDPDEDAEDDPDPVADAPSEVEEPLPFTRNSMRIALEPAQARAFARRALAIVAAGRPPCPFCGGPLDSTGHICPRANGFRR